MGPQIKVRMQPWIDSKQFIYVIKKKKFIRIEKEGFLDKACFGESWLGSKELGFTLVTSIQEVEEPDSGAEPDQIASDPYLL